MPPHLFASIDAKLNRADEHIHEFAAAEGQFFGEESDRSIVYNDAETAKAFRDKHESRLVPLSLSVIAGEAIQQLRSSLDHLVTLFVLRNNATTTLITQFPICFCRPIKQDELRRYERQIHGTSTSVQAVIERHQPYHAEHGSGAHYLYILKTLSNRDKHHALILSVIAIRTNVRFTGTARDGNITIEAVEPAPDAGTDGYRLGAVEGEIEIVNVQRSLTAYVAFPTLGTKKNVPVFGGLWSLSRNTRKVIDTFRSEIP